MTGAIIAYALPSERGGAVDSVRVWRCVCGGGGDLCGGGVCVCVVCVCGGGCVVVVVVVVVVVGCVCVCV